MANYASAILRDAPIGYWRLNEKSGDAQDASGFGHAGAASGTILYQQPALVYGDPTAASCYFNGTDVGGFTTSTIPALSQTALSVEWWYIAPRSAQNNDEAFGQQGSLERLKQGGNDIQMYAYMNASADFAGPRRLRFRYFRDWTTDGKPHHRVVTFSVNSANHAEAREYEDGVLMQDANLSGVTIHGVDYTGDAGVPSGGFWWATARFGPEAQIYMAEGALYNTTLSQAQISAHFAAGSPPLATNVKLAEPVMTALIKVLQAGLPAALTKITTVYADGVPLPAIKKFYFGERFVKPEFPCVVVDHISSHIDEERFHFTWADYDHTLDVDVLVVGNNEDILARQIERYQRAIWEVLFGNQTDQVSGQPVQAISVRPIEGHASPIVKEEGFLYKGWKWRLEVHRYDDLS